MPTNRKVLEKLKRYESPNVTFIAPDGSWPIVWEKARGMHVWDIERNKYLDWTSAFGVAAAGHANSKVVQAGQRQMRKLLHAMGDVHPHQPKADLARALSRITFERWTGSAGKTIFCNSGFEAVEAALKTAYLFTQEPRVLAFSGGYHGLGYGSLNLTHRAHFRRPFLPQLKQFGVFLPFPHHESTLPILRRQIQKLYSHKKFGAILVEPIQGRAGIHIPPAGFLAMLRDVAHSLGVLLIFDEIFTGFGRTGKWFACEHESTFPDLLCLGKALTGGFPLSACVGREDLMDAAWPISEGEALHTSTFLGHPVGCAMALAQIEEVASLLVHAGKMGAFLAQELKDLAGEFPNVHHRCRGLLGALEFQQPNLAFRMVKELLQRGYLFLPEGELGNILSFCPPLLVSRQQIRKTCQEVGKVLRTFTGPAK